ncbi:CBO0543 family protein [Desulfuribacillus alkaliarsenatis]|uniref:Uncharacterized protein n=1 Tax=Desulfuribacillus alkaliarsenatis TaxID=766136 RepID=A0A1E5G296_9FIRM|nr:CBO0543 family protein [Desulfuribacillus alkaliarsenatis]OEF97095.1 hypothetical protein BHF68_05715 [Desulfuribacillus alkaliarsenatis]
MHVATTTIAVIAAYFYGDWRNWERYHATILFFAVGNLLYNFLAANYLLWYFTPDLLPSHSHTEMLYTFIVFPATILMFLNNYPTDTIGKIYRNLKWIAIYGVWEYVFYITGRIEYQYGWTLWWSIAFLCVMFPLLALHPKRPLLTYALSTVVVVFVLWYFDVPVHLPIELRRQY